MADSDPVAPSRKKKIAPPLTVLAGGVAAGAVLGLLVPRHAKERHLLAPLGRKLAEGSGSALKAARTFGKAEIDALLPGRERARDRIGLLVDHVITAARDAASKA